MTEFEAQSVLHILFELARAGLPANAEKLAARLAMKPAKLQSILQTLDRAKLVDAKRCRLTLVGLAIASSARAEAISHAA